MGKVDELVATFGINVAPKPAKYYMETKELVLLETCKGAIINNYGSIDGIEIEEKMLVPKVSSGKIVVEVFAASINPADIKIINGQMHANAPLKFPAVPGLDFSGIVSETGNDITDYKPGDKIYGQTTLFKDSYGAFAEFALTEPSFIAPKPENLSFIEATSLPLVGTSALQALTEHIKLSKGNKILIHGGAGGIGSIAIQLAKHLGAYIATTAKEADREFVTTLGVDQVIDYSRQEFANILSNFDAVFDTVGGETYTKSFKVLKKGGTIVSMIENPDDELAHQYQVKAIGQFTKVTHERLLKLKELAEKRAIKPCVYKIFELEELTEALKYQQEKHVQGKLVLKMNDMSLR